MLTYTMSYNINLFRHFLSLIILIVSAILCYQIVSGTLTIQKNKFDYSELNHVKYGLLSVSEWKRQITLILIAEINKLNLSKSNEKVLRKHIKALLNTLIDKVDKQIRASNSESTGGRISQSFINMFVDMDNIKKGIPEYADAVIREMKKVKSKRQLKTVLKDQLEQYSEQTFDIQDTTLLNSILARTNSIDIAEARVNLEREIALSQEKLGNQVMTLISLVVILFFIAGFGKSRLTPTLFIFLILALLILLIAGVTTPTIDMEAKISQISFMLIGHQIHFENQVLYFQSKSILDVFWIMITHADIKMKFVGVLLVTFSVLFPLTKIALSPAYYFNYLNANNNPLVKFIIHKSGKWSMADVMVVAIFMAYIGFNGIISSQFGHLNKASQEVVILTTNATSLQPGFYLFLSYTLLAMILSGLLSRTNCKAPAALLNSNV